MPLPPSSVDTALSATSEVDGVTVISSPRAVTLLSPTATVDAMRSVVTRARSARCRNDHKPSRRFSATTLAVESSCRNRDNIKPTLLGPPVVHEKELRSCLQPRESYRTRDAIPPPLPPSFINLPRGFRPKLVTIYPRENNEATSHIKTSHQYYSADSPALAARSSRRRPSNCCFLLLFFFFVYIVHRQINDLAFSQVGEEKALFFDRPRSKK